MQDIKKKILLTNKAAQLALLQTKLKKQASQQLSEENRKEKILVSGDTVAGIGIAILMALLFAHVLF